MGIPVGAELRSTHGDIVVTVVGPKKVRLADEELSLTAATMQVLQIEHAVQPTPHWAYNGKSLKDIYEETYGESE